MVSRPACAIVGRLLIDCVCVSVCLLGGGEGRGEKAEKEGEFRVVRLIHS